MLFLQDVCKREVPVLGICFGFHALTEALGGTVIHDHHRSEERTFDVTRNEASDYDPVISLLPRAFTAQFGHNDHVETLPAGAINLASTHRSEIQAWTIPGKPIYAAQFHAEMDQKATEERLTYYKDKYYKTEDHFQNAMHEILPSPDAPKFLEYFFTEVVLGKKTYPVD